MDTFVVEVVQIEGKQSLHKNKAVCYPGTDFEPRTDFEFRNSTEKCYVKHKNVESPLQRIPGIDMIKCCPRDYMHLVCLGMNKKLLGFWTKKPTTNKTGQLSTDQISEVDRRILIIC